MAYDTKSTIGALALLSLAGSFTPVVADDEASSEVGANIEEALPTCEEVWHSQKSGGIMNTPMFHVLE